MNLFESNMQHYYWECIAMMELSLIKFRMPSSLLFAINNEGKTFGLSTKGTKWREFIYLGSEFTQISAVPNFVLTIRCERQIYMHAHGLDIPIRVKEETYENERWTPFDGFYDFSQNYDADDDNGNTYPKGKPPRPVTPKMLIKALKKLKKNSFKGLFFTPKEVTYEIINTHPYVEHDFAVLFLEVSDKLHCAAAAGLVGAMHDLGYFAYDHEQREARSYSGSELMFWIFYKKMLKKKAEVMKLQEEAVYSIMVPKKKEKIREKKVVRLMSFTGDDLHLIPLIHYRHKIVRQE